MRTTWEFVSCLWEVEFWRRMWDTWGLYVDLGEHREKLSRQVRREIAHIPRDPR